MTNISWRNRQIGMNQLEVQEKALKRAIDELIASDAYNTEEGQRSRNNLETELVYMRVARKEFLERPYNDPKWWEGFVVSLYKWSVKDRFSLDRGQS